MTKFVTYYDGDRIFVTTKKNEVKFLEALRDYHPNGGYYIDDLDREEIDSIGVSIDSHIKVGANFV